MLTHKSEPDSFSMHPGSLDDFRGLDLGLSETLSGPLGNPASRKNRLVSTIRSHNPFPRVLSLFYFFKTFYQWFALVLHRFLAAKRESAENSRTMVMKATSLCVAWSISSRTCVMW